MDRIMSKFNNDSREIASVYFLSDLEKIALTYINNKKEVQYDLFIEDNPEMNPKVLEWLFKKGSIAIIQFNVIKLTERGYRLLRYNGVNNE